MLDRIKQGLPAEETSGAASASGSVRPSAVTVAIRNGAGVGGIAADAAGRLTPKGFRITEMGNANQFVYEETLVVYKEGGEAKANLVRESLGMGKVIPSRGMYSFSADVLVVVGRDWKPSSATGAQ
ncbi:MAG: LytR C-terminal domain-containing protein [Actinomycetota bacterium]|nr:LytR C-terminal domain-containing protein [Actinomycetota bacterium]